MPVLIGKKVVFFAGAIIVGWKVVPWLMNKFSPLKVSEAVLTMAIAQTPQKKEVTQKIETVAYSIFVPVFFTSIGVIAELRGIGDGWGLAVLLSVIAILTKWVGSGLGAKFTGFNTRSSVGIGAGMISRGEVALIIATIGRVS